MKKIIILSLLCLFLSGCIDDTMKIWRVIDNIGDKSTFKLYNKYIDEERYYRIERISEEKFKSLRTKEDTK